VQGTPYLVAIVDDEESVRRALGRLVRSAGFHVQTFGSGAEFLSSVGRSPPHCVVLDVRMPHMNGFEVQLALTEQRADISAEIRQQTLSRGAKAYLRKPVDEAMLLDAIQSAIRKESSRRADS
jgi:FixJ family two-component response regulator